MSEPSFPLPKSSLLPKASSQEGETKPAYIKYEVESGFTVRLRQNFDPAMDPRKLRRLISNRVSAQISNSKKKQYFEDLKKKSDELQRNVSMLRSLVERASEEKKCLESEQKELKECLSGWLQHIISIQGEIEMNQLEIEMLKKKIDPFSNITNFC